MNLNRREALKLGLAGAGAFLSPFGMMDSAQAAEMLECDHEPLP